MALTGHRDNKIVDIDAGLEFLDSQLKRWRPDTLICGMANGWDLCAGMYGLERGVDIVAARPWLGHKPTKDDRKVYKTILDEAVEIVVVNQSVDYPGPWVYQARNKWMVDHCDMVVAYFDGSSGGTNNCINYAISRDVPIVRFNPQTLEVDDGK